MCWMPSRWFTRYSGWGPGQLQRECASGVWFTAAASSAFILQQGEKDRGATGREMWHQVSFPLYLILRGLHRSCTITDEAGWYLPAWRQLCVWL